MLGKNDILTFGKFKGKSIKWIADNHPQYIVWVDENIKTKSIDQKIVADCRYTIDSNLPYEYDPDYK